MNKKMKDNYGNNLRVIWKHPDLDGQYVSGYTKREAQSLIKVITGRWLLEDDFISLNKFCYVGRIFSGDIYERVKIAPDGHFPNCSYTY